MENMAGDWDSKKNLVKELTRGKEMAKQLQMILSNGVSSSSQEPCEYLLHNILVSFEKGLSALTWSNSVPGSFPASVITNVAIPMSESPPSHGGSPRSDQDSDRDQELRDASKKRKSFPRWTKQVRVNPGMGLEGHLDDGFSWRKYGQKDILGAKYPRGYFRCTRRNVQGCLATKQVQRSSDDSTVFDITYRGAHTCAQPSNPNLDPQIMITNNNTNNINDIINDHDMLSSFKTDLKIITQGLLDDDDNTNISNNNNNNIIKTESLSNDNRLIVEDNIGFVGPAAYFTASQVNSSLIHNAVTDPISINTQNVVTSDNNLEEIPFGHVDDQLDSDHNNIFVFGHPKYF